MLINRIKGILEEQGMSINQLADTLKMGYKGVHTMVNRESIDTTKIGTIHAVAKALDVKISDLYHEGYYYVSENVYYKGHLVEDNDHTVHTGIQSVDEAKELTKEYFSTSLAGYKKKADKVEFEIWLSLIAEDVSEDNEEILISTIVYDIDRIKVLEDIMSDVENLEYEDGSDWSDVSERVSNYISKYKADIKTPAGFLDYKYDSSSFDGEKWSGFSTELDLELEYEATDMSSEEYTRAKSEGVGDFLLYKDEIVEALDEEYERITD